MKSKLINKHMWKYVDWALVAIIVLIVGYGIVSIINATASPFTGDESTFAQFMENLNLGTAERQLMFFGIGLGIMFVILLLDYHIVRNMTEIIYWACIVLLVIVLNLGTEVNGTTGWFRIGDYGLQPSEFCKIGVVLVLAKVISDKTEGHEDGINKIRDIIPALWRFAIPFALIMAQPDFGTAIVYAFIFFVMLFMAKTNWKILLLLIAVCIIAVVVIYPFLKPYQQSRISVWWNPEAQEADDLLQTQQAKMAIGSGGLTGKGLFAPGSLSQLDYVPEKHNDFIFAVTVEAFGFIGGAALIVLYFLLISRTFMLAMRAKDDYGAYIIIGVGAMMLFHTFENIGMNIGLLPVTGIPLPFFSYGGSNLLTSMIAYGIVLSVDMRRTRWPIG
ncbi:rod shape-determining protein RodA [Christensenellaceae bacterium OttesenSCG-928-K19]|nr:rod shape-determining protein RodA [Christensenellaceae bacterium OttesenSCG-928-K19]